MIYRNTQKSNKKYTKFVVLLSASLVSGLLIIHFFYRLNRRLNPELKVTLAVPMKERAPRAPSAAASRGWLSPAERASPSSAAHRRPICPSKSDRRDRCTNRDRGDKPPAPPRPLGPARLARSWRAAAMRTLAMATTGRGHAWTSHTGAAEHFGQVKKSTHLTLSSSIKRSRRSSSCSGDFNAGTYPMRTALWESFFGRL